MAVVQQIAVIALLAASLIVWTVILQRWLRGQPVIAYEPRDPIPWGVLDIFVTVCLFLASTQVVFALSGGNAAESSRRIAASNSAASQSSAQVDGSRALWQQFAVGSATLIGSLLWMTLARRATWSDLGWQRGHLVRDVRLGCGGFLAAAPPTFLLQGILTRWFPYRHLVTDTLGTEPELKTLLLAAAMVVLMAPLVEEYLFRLLLQGWCERLDDQWRIPAPLPRTPAPRRWPVLVSSVMFALLHLGQGPAPVPLFVLALGMGYLYRQTHRQMPSLVMHGCFNATNIVMIALTRGISMG